MLENSPLVWAEIAVTDMNRAITFYQTHFGLSFTQQVIGDIDMAIVETASQDEASFALMKHEMMVPSVDGATVYLHLSPALKTQVTQLEQANIHILLPPMPIKDGECGYIAIFKDSEGNKVGLWSKDL